MVHGLVCIPHPADNTRQPWGAALSFTGGVTAVAAGLARLATILRHQQHVMWEGLLFEEGLVGSEGLRMRFFGSPFHAGCCMCVNNGRCCMEGLKVSVTLIGSAS